MGVNKFNSSQCELSDISTFNMDTTCKVLSQTKRFRFHLITTTTTMVKTNDKIQRFGVVIAPLSRKKYVR